MHLSLSLSETDFDKKKKCNDTFTIPISKGVINIYGISALRVFFFQFYESYCGSQQVVKFIKCQPSDFVQGYFRLIRFKFYATSVFLLDWFLFPHNIFSPPFS